MQEARREPSLEVKLSQPGGNCSAVGQTDKRREGEGEASGGQREGVGAEAGRIETGRLWI